MKQTYHTIPEALEDLRAGKVIQVVVGTGVVGVK